MVKRPDPEMAVYGEPPIKGGNGRSDKQVEDASDIGFYLWCALFVVAAVGAALLVLRACA